MQVVLYTMTSDPTYYNKVKNEIATLDCEFKNPIDIEHPTILIKGKYHNCNYFYIPYFNRYYFVTSVTGVSDDLVEFVGESDVLSSVNIPSLTAMVERQEYKRNNMLIDNEIIQQSNNNFICKQVGVPVNSNYEIYITTCGGGN